MVTALKGALRGVYWYKDDLRLFFQTCELPPALIAKQGWHDPQEYKVRIAGRILDELVAMGEEGVGPMRRLIQALLDIRSLDHLRHLEDGAEKVSAARKSIEALREIVYRHDETFRRQQEEQAARKDALAEALRRKNDERERLQGQFYEVVGNADHQQRGLLFEKFLRDLFDAYDLNPRGSFRITGEQIDGAFEFETTQYLMEAKWQKEPVGTAPLDSFSKKVDRKLENTLGFFISLNGFAEEGLTAFRGTRPAVILMDGEDLAVVLQGLLDFRDLLKRKVRYASQTGDPFLRARDM